MELRADRNDSSVQVNIPAESGEMGILAQHVPSIEQLKPGLVEIIQENGENKQFFRTSSTPLTTWERAGILILFDSLWRFCRRSARLEFEHQRSRRLPH